MALVSLCMHLQIIFAREFLKDVRMKPDQVKYLVQNARNGMCQGHRAELFAVKAAKACAALAVRPPDSANSLHTAGRHETAAQHSAACRLPSSHAHINAGTSGLCL